MGLQIFLNIIGETNTNLHSREERDGSKSLAPLEKDYIEQELDLECVKEEIEVKP